MPGNITDGTYPLVTAVDVDSDDTFLVVVDGLVKRMTNDEHAKVSALTSRYSFFVNVKAYGAVGNDIADDTAAFVAAIAAANGTAPYRGAIFIPAGIYRVSSSIAVTLGWLSILGAGREVSIIRYTGSSGFAIDCSTSGPHQFANFTIDGTSATGSAGALRLNGNLTKNTVTNVGFTTFATTEVAVHLNGASENTFDMCKWDGNSRNLKCSDGLGSTANANTFRRCNLGNTVSNAGACIEWVNVEGCVLVDCLIQSARNLTTVLIHNTAGAVGFDTRANKIVDCYFEENGNSQAGSRGIHLKGASGRPVRATVIRGNGFFQSFQDNPSRQIDLEWTVDTFIDEDYAILGTPHVIVYDGGNNVGVRLGQNAFIGTVQFPQPQPPSGIVVADLSGGGFSVVNGGIPRKVLWTEIIDTFGTWAANTFTAKVAGWYRVLWVASTENSDIGQQFVFAIYKNGAAVRSYIYKTVGTSPESVLLEGVVYLNGTTDYVETYVTNSGATNRNIGNGAVYTNLTITAVAP